MRVWGSSVFEHRLEGFEPDNFLAFLALIGVLRVLEAERAEWHARLAWNGVPLRPTLTIAEKCTPEDLGELLACGVHAFAAAYAFDEDDIKYTPDSLRAVARKARAASMARADIIAALGSDGVCKRSGDVVEPTPLCAMLGSGHQHFLRRLANAAASRTAGATISRSLFRPWTYDDAGESFRWDPVEDRRYAYQSGNPSDSGNKIGIMLGANRLAATGFGIWACSPAARGLRVRGIIGRGATRTVSWPIVSLKTSLDGHLALLAHPFLIDERARLLSAYGVSHVARANRYQVGKYFNFARAVLQPLTAALSPEPAVR